MAAPSDDDVRRPLSGAGVLRESVTETIRRAVFEELAEAGYARMSMEAVTRRAGVGKAALYRRWPSKEAMVVELVSEAAAAHIPTTSDSGSLHGDVERFLRETLRALRHPLVGRIIPDLLAESARSASLHEALHLAVLGPRRAAVATLLERAALRGELPPGTDTALATDLFGAPLYFRVLAAGGPTDDAYVTRLTHAVVAAVAASR